MPFLELTLPCPEPEQPRYERALENVGALAVTLTDAHADAPDEQAIFEPGVGETPRVGRDGADGAVRGRHPPELLLHALAAADEGLDWSRARFRDVADQDWERAWMDQYEPLQFGSRTWIVPWNRELPDGADADGAAVVRLDPGLAFGSGTHPTTALCLQWLESSPARSTARRARARFRLRLGHPRPGRAQARCRARGRRRQRSTSPALHPRQRRAQWRGRRLQVHLPGDEPAATYPVVVANILAKALVALADTLAARVAPGGRIAMSGILAGQEDEVIARYADTFEDLRADRLEDWMRVTGVRRS